MKLTLQTLRDTIAHAEPDMVDMAVLGMPQCGSPGCIVGWAGAILYPQGMAPYPPDLFSEVYDQLGINKLTGDAMSLGNMGHRDIHDLRITKSEVLACLDNLIAEGRVAWPRRVATALYSAQEYMGRDCPDIRVL